MRRVHVSHSRAKGFELHIVETRAWGVFVEWLSMRVCDLTGNRLCTWAWCYPAVNWLHTAEWTAQTAEWHVPIDDATAHAISEPGAWDYLKDEDGQVA